MTQNVRIEHVCKDHGIVTIAGGRRMSVTTWLDDFGDDCQPEDAVACVAGSDESGWVCIDLRLIPNPTFH